MARGINKVILIGNLGRDPETRYTQGGSAVTNLRIATSEQWRDRQTGEQQERTEWHTVVCFARLAEIAGEYLRKGSKVYIEGRLQTRKWQDQSGQDRYSTEVVANDMQMLDSRGGGGADMPIDDREGMGASSGPAPARTGAPPRAQAGGGAARGPKAQPQRPPVDDAADDLDDDIPF